MRFDVRSQLVPAIVAICGLVLLSSAIAAVLSQSGVTTTAASSTTLPAGTADPAPDRDQHRLAAPILATPAHPCGLVANPPQRFAHVIVLVLENHSYDQIIGRPGSPAAGQAPYLNLIARRCGLATDYRSITHPSLPNYLAITGGSTFGITSDTNALVSAPTIFSELGSAGDTWAVYAEDMPSPCATHRTSPTGYTPHHNPVVTYSDLAGQCATHDLPLGRPSAGPLATALHHMTLPAYAFIAPALGHDMHTGSIRVGDDWVAGWIKAIIASPTYQHQPTAVFITFDEGTGGHIGKGENCAAHPADQSCHVPLIVISPYVQPGTTVATPANHYSLLRTTGELLGVPPLAFALRAPGLRAAFNL